MGRTTSVTVSHRNGQCPPTAGFGASAIAVAAVAALLAGGCGKKVGGGSPQDKARELAAIAAKQPHGGGKVLADALSDPDPHVRKVALVGLGGYATPQHREAIERATHDEHPEVRTSAVCTLGLYRDEAAAERLGTLLRGDPAEAVRTVAASGLGENPSKKAIVLLLENAENNTNANAQYQAMTELLGKLGLRFHRKVDPKGSEWRSLVEEMKHSKIVQAAYAACGVDLVYHPEDKKPNAPGHDK